MALPAGTVTFLFTDIEGSTRLLSEHPKEYSSALLRLDTLVRSSVDAAHGKVFETVGDAIYAAFERPADALIAAIAAQRALRAEDWGALGAVRMRMAAHTGEVEVRGDHYFGAPLYRCARLMAIGHGGQVLVSAVTAGLVAGALPGGAQLREMGLHRLKDFPEPERVLGLAHPDLASVSLPLRSFDAVPNNLPIQSTPFIGRHAERRGVIAALAEHRLVSLTGAGGSGKTRLALEAAGDVLAEYPDGVWVVELAALSERDLVPQAFAQVLRLKEEPGRPLAQTLLDALRTRTTLLLVDNCEHLLDAVAAQVDAILRTAPGVRILATSREPLAMGAEGVFPVGPLGDADAVALFADRAHGASDSFALGPATSATVAAICRRLDGIPLAIELAASRVRAFAVDEIERRLDDRLGFLTSGDRAALPRQRTLRALIEWSYDLLDPRERELLAALSVFNGGFDLEAAERVCAVADGRDEVATLVGRLVDKSLVEVQLPRYRLLDTIRAFAADKLGPRAPATRDRHLSWCADLAERADLELSGAQQAESLDRLEREHDNMRAALRWAAAAHERQTGIRLAVALSPFWVTRGHFSEGRGWLERFLALPPRSGPGVKALEAKALGRAGSLAYNQADYDGAQRWCEAAMAIYRKLGDKRGMSAALSRLGIIAGERGDLARARALFEESLAAARETGDPRRIATALSELGLCAQHAGDHDRAWSLLEEALEMERTIDPKGIVFTLNNLGTVAHSRGDYARAAAIYKEGLAIARELGSQRNIAVLLRNLGEVAYLEGDHATAALRFTESLGLMRDLGLKGTIPGLLDVLATVATHAGMPKRGAILFGAAAGIRDSLGATRRPADWPAYEDSLALTRAALDDGSFAAAWAEGKAMTPDLAIAFALDTTNG